MKAENPIGIFDSGIGGLTVAAAINKLMPNENFVYFGDTAHMPYGDKSSKAIKHFALKITDFLLQKHCKAIVIACNTASAVAFKEVKQRCIKKAIAINVIDPVIQSLADINQVNKVGIIGTKRTVSTRAYTRRIKQKLPALISTELATPLLAPMIEEGFFNNKISKAVIASYLSKKSLENIDTLVLACTHYPLIQKEIESYYHHKINILDSAQAAAMAVKIELQKQHLLNITKRKPKLEFLVSDLTDSFKASTPIFFPGKIRLAEHNLWNLE